MTTTKSAVHKPGSWTAAQMIVSGTTVAVPGWVRPIECRAASIARRIALCVNTHDELVAALRLIAEHDHPSHPLFGDEKRGPTIDALAEIARAALARAEGRE